MEGNLKKWLVFFAWTAVFVFVVHLYHTAEEKTSNTPEESASMAQCFQKGANYISFSSVTEKSEPAVVEALEFFGWERTAGIECVNPSNQKTFYLFEKKQEKGFILVFLPEKSLVFSGESLEGMEEDLEDFLKK